MGKRETRVGILGRETSCQQRRSGDDGLWKGGLKG